MTLRLIVGGYLHQIYKKSQFLETLKVIAFTHKSIPLNELGRFFLNEQNHDERLRQLKVATGINELLYLSTCNRIEFLFTSSETVDGKFLNKFLKGFSNDLTDGELSSAVKSALIYEGEDAVKHLMSVASSLDSMVVGEREIITQVRNAYDRCHAAGLTGDSLRLVIKNVITTAKQVFTDTHIAENPVSVVSLAFRKLRNLNAKSDTRFIIVGAGETNANLLKYMAKHGYKNFAIFNRTLSKAEALAEKFSSNGGEASAHSLDKLNNYSKGFDVLISCTGASEPVITVELFKKLAGNNRNKILIDLAIPADIEKEVVAKFPVHYIGMSQLKEEADRNLLQRETEINVAEKIIEAGIKEFQTQLRTRKLELKMSQVPQKIRDIKSKALNDVFAEEIEKMDESAKEVLSRVLDYIEKKYISVPMVMAKALILDSPH